MKKIVVLCITLFFLAGMFPVSAQVEIGKDSAPVEYTSLVFDDLPGAYAIYRDTRFGETAYIGLCVIGGNELALRLFVPSTKTELLVFETFYTTGSASDPAGLQIESGTIDLIRGDFSATDATKRLLPSVNEWLTSWLHSRSRFKEMPEYCFDNDGTYSFQYWIPILQMKGLDSGLTLVTSGFVQAGLDPVFFEYSGETPIVEGPSFTIASGEVRSEVIDGISIPLDATWVRSPDGVYRIAKVTIQDAYCMVETLNMSQFGNIDTFDLIKLFLLHSGGTLMCESVRIFNLDGNPCVFYRVYDPATQQVSVQYKVFVSRNDTSLSVISLGAFESVYNGNKAYFDRILSLK